MENNNKPQAGFATTADGGQTNDAYQMYADAISPEGVFDALQTEAGRQAVGA